MKKMLERLIKSIQHQNQNQNHKIRKRKKLLQVIINLIINEYNHIENLDKNEKNEKKII